MVEHLVKSCIPCQATTRSATRPEPLVMSTLPAQPWCNISIDFGGPLPSNDLLLVVTDDYSRFPEVEIVSSTSAAVVIPKLDAIFSRQGVPEVVRSDNGPPFQGSDFADFAADMGFTHRRVTPLWPQANGQVERFMDTVMKSIRAAHLEGKLWKRELLRFLRQYRATPHTTTGVAPAEALYRRRFRTQLPQLPAKDLPLLPDVHSQIKLRDATNKAKMKQYADKRRRVKPCEIREGDHVLVKQQRRNKGSPHYDPVPFVVETRKGNMVIARRGVQKITRNITFFKRLTGSINPDPLPDEPDTFSEPPPDETTLHDRGPQPVEDAPLKPCLKSADRPQRARKLPVRFRDYLGVPT
ncbi:PREDICTED: uncharacterized protein K02A2.6-like [Priapulus caudatus]|uniref:Uncharacterized protein K02A2.6-like n=1 Tax=Priapulus caudatus TaxID=37621 RepID=A0ABM1E2C5_PRICU|nr:PREDICTED: uncharacterized protein K02A2.6-like [Priapulus caudatus]